MAAAYSGPSCSCSSRTWVPGGLSPFLFALPTAPGFSEISDALGEAPLTFAGDGICGNTEQ